MAHYLLDANVLIWWLSDDPRLSPEVLRMLENDSSCIHVSILTLFEIELKTSNRRLQVGGNLIVDVLEKYAIDICHPMPRELPDILSYPVGHKDPFDRAVIGLASLRGWKLVTSDAVLIKQSGKKVKVIDSRK